MIKVHAVADNGDLGELLAELVDGPRCEECGHRPSPHSSVPSCENSECPCWFAGTCCSMPGWQSWHNCCWLVLNELPAELAFVFPDGSELYNCDVGPHPTR